MRQRDKSSEFWRTVRYTIAAERRTARAIALLVTAGLLLALLFVIRIVLQ